MDGPIKPMYKMKPVFEVSGGISVNTTMYGMKNLQDSTLEKTGSDLSETEYVEIEERQARVLKTLSELKEKLKSIKDFLTRKDVEPVITAPLPKSDVSVNEMFPELVLNSSIHHPPYSLLAVHAIWNGTVRINLSCHIHSSLSTLPEHLRVFENLSGTSNSNNVSNLDIRLVWKQLTSDCEFIVSPAKYIALQGEVNMLRFIHRTIFPSANKEEEIILDEKLDACHSLKFCQSNKEVQSILHSLLVDSTNSTWLHGNKISLVDIAAWSAIKSLKKPDLNKRWSMWLKECNKVIGIPQ